MTNFSLSRTIYLIKYDLITRRSKHLQGLMILFFIFLGVFLLFMQKYGGITYAAKNSMLTLEYLSFQQKHITSFMDDILGMTTLILIIYNVTAISDAFSDPIGSKSRRLSFFLIPATNSERFFSRIGIYVFDIIAFFAVFLIARAFSMIFLLFLKGDPAVIGSWNFVMMNNPNINFSGMIYPRTFFFLAGFCAFSFYLLGAAYWQKHAFIKTTICAFIYLFIFAKIINLFHLADNTEELVIDIHSVILSLVCLIGGYCVFVKTQLTRPRILRLIK